MKDDTESYVSYALREQKKKLGLNHYEASEILAAKINVRPTTAKTLLHRFETGSFYGSPSKIGREENGSIYLARLAAYIELLGFEEQKLYELNKRLREFDIRYSYPPDTQKLTKIKDR